MNEQRKRERGKKRTTKKGREEREIGMVMEEEKRIGGKGREGR